MRNFISRNKGYIIASLMIVGGVLGFMGLDWEQSQIISKANASVPMMVTGGAMFVAGAFWLATSTWGRRTKQ
jgi:hypothetical protein